MPVPHPYNPRTDEDPYRYYAQRQTQPSLFTKSPSSTQFYNQYYNKDQDPYRYYAQRQTQPSLFAKAPPPPGRGGRDPYNKPRRTPFKMVHPQLGQVKGPPSERIPSEEVREEAPYPVYIRPYDDDLPQVTWRKHPMDAFGTLTIVKGEEKMVVKVPIESPRFLPRTNYPVEISTVIIFFVIAAVVWKLL